MSSELKKFLRQSALFLGGLLLMVVLMELALRHNLPSPEAKTYAALFSKIDASSAIIIGNSTALYGIDPRMLQTSTGSLDLRSIRNFGIGGTKISFHRQWYDLLYKRFRPQPKLIIFAVNWFSFSYADPNIRRIEDDSRFFPLRTWGTLLIDPSIQKKLFLTNALFLFHLHDIRTDIVHLFVPRGIADGIRLDQEFRGYVPLDRTLGHGPGFAVDDETAPRPAELAAFSALLSEWKAAGINVIVVQAPVYTPGVHLPDYAFIKRLTDEAGVPFLDYNGDRAAEFARSPLLFADTVHLNATGADLFSRILRTDLEKAL